MIYEIFTFFQSRVSITRFLVFGFKLLIVQVNENLAKDLSENGTEEWRKERRQGRDESEGKDIKK